MAVQIQSPLFVFALLVLVHLHTGAHGRPIQDTHSHNHLLNQIFFRQTALKPGNSIPLYFHPKNPNKTPKFLPKPVSDSLPFSLPHLPSLLKTLQIHPSSPQANSMSQTLTHCLKPPIHNESKFCSTSLESLLDSLREQFGSGYRPELLTTDARAGSAVLQIFKVVEEPKEIGSSYSVACHPMPFPYAVFYCHGQRGSNKLYEVEMETERDGVLLRVRVLGMCHMDTAEWDPDHVAFRVLGIRPGEEPVCHAIPLDTLVWVASRNSTGGVLKTVV